MAKKNKNLSTLQQKKEAPIKPVPLSITKTLKTGKKSDDLTLFSSMPIDFTNKDISIECTSGLIVNKIKKVEPTVITLDVDTTNASPEQCEIKVLNGEGKEIASGLVNIEPQLEKVTINPETVPNNKSSFLITLQGLPLDKFYDIVTNYPTLADVDITGETKLNRIQYLDANTIELNVSTLDATPGNYDIIFTNDKDETLTLYGILKIFDITEE